MRNYAMERFLERISLSKYRNNFILKERNSLQLIAEGNRILKEIVDSEVLQKVKEIMEGALITWKK